METGKTGKYLKYAIGEIILVVIGILIALQINNANEARKLRQIERSYLERLVVDLKENEILWENRHKREKQRLASAWDLLEFSFSDNQDTLVKVLRNFQPVANFRDLIINQVTFNEMVSSGNLDLISNDSIKLKLLDLEKRYLTIKSRWTRQKDYVLENMVKSINSKISLRYTVPINIEYHNEISRTFSQNEVDYYYAELLKEFKILFNSKDFLNNLMALATDANLIVDEYKQAKIQVEELIRLIEIDLKSDTEW